MGSRAGLREKRSVRVVSGGNRHTEMSVLAGAAHHIGYDAMKTSNFRDI